MASVRYIVADVDKAVAFYRDNLDFNVDMHNPGKFAALLRDDLTLYLSAPGAGSGGQAGGDPSFLTAWITPLISAPGLASSRARAIAKTPVGPLPMLTPPPGPVAYAITSSPGGGRFSPAGSPLPAACAALPNGLMRGMPRTSRRNLRVFADRSNR